MSHIDFDGSDIVRACIRKKGYPLEKFAHSAVAAILRASPDADVRVYACRHCGLWHVGGSPGTGTRDASLQHRKDRRRPVTTDRFRGRERRHDALSERIQEEATAHPRSRRERYADADW